MALLDPTVVAVAASLVVALVAGALAVLGWRSYQVTENRRLLFVITAFVLFLAKSVFTAYNVQTHLVQHDSIEAVGAFFDMAIILVLFAPFVLPKPG